MTDNNDVRFFSIDLLPTKYILIILNNISIDRYDTMATGTQILILSSVSFSFSLLHKYLDDFGGGGMSTSAKDNLRKEKSKKGR